MNKLDIPSCLATSENEELLKIMFCCEFDENKLHHAKEEGSGFFVRLYFDCRTGKLGTTVCLTQESARKQLYNYYQEESLHFIPLVSYWIHEDAPAFYHWDETSLYPIERLESVGWSKWRKDAVEYIKQEYEKYTPDGYFA